MPSNDSDRVAPGELITAEFMNSLLTRIEEIESTLDELDASDKDLTITSLQPAGPVRVGASLRVLGRDFAPLSETVVTVGNERIDAFDTGSNASRLVFNVPQIENLSGGSNGTEVQLTVSGKYGFDDTTVSVLPFQPSVPEGQIFIRLAQQPDVQAIEAGNRYTFTLAVRVISNLRETFDLQAGIATQTQPQDWSATPVDENDDSISTIQFPESGPPGTEKMIPVEVEVPQGTEGATARLTFAVTSRKNPQGFAKTFESSEIEVGETPPEAEDIAIERSDIVQGARVANDGKTLVVTGAAVVGYSASVPENNVDYVVRLQNIPEDWEPKFAGGGTQQTVSGTQGQVVFEIRIPVPSAGTADGTFAIRVEQDGDASVFGTFEQPLRRGNNTG